MLGLFMWPKIKYQLKETPKIVWVIITVAVILRVFLALTLNFYGDEVIGPMEGELILKKGFPIYETGGCSPKGGIMRYLSAIIFAIFGLKVWAFRLPNLLFSIFGLWLVYYAGNKFFNKTTGILATLLCSFDITMVVWGGTYSMIYSTVVYLVLLCFIAIHYSLKYPNYRNVILTSLLIIVTIWIHPTAIVYLFGFAFVYIIYSQGFDRFSFLGMLMVLFGAGLIMFYVRFIADPGLFTVTKKVVIAFPAISVQKFLGDGFLYFRKHFFTRNGDYFLYWPTQLVIFTAFWYLFSFRFKKIKDTPYAQNIIAFSFFIMIPIFGFQFFGTMNSPLYLLPLKPFYYIIACYGICELIQGNWLSNKHDFYSSKYLKTLQILLFLSLFSLFLWPNIISGIKIAKLNDKGLDKAYSYVKKHTKPGDAYLNANASMYFAAAPKSFSYYYIDKCNTLALRKTGPNSFGSRQWNAPWVHTKEELKKIFNKHRRVWFIMNTKKPYYKATFHIIKKYMKLVFKAGRHKVYFYNKSFSQKSLSKGVK